MNGLRLVDTISCLVVTGPSKMPCFIMTQRLCSIHFSYPVIHHLLAIVNEAIGNYDVDTNGGKRFFFKGET